MKRMYLVAFLGVAISCATAQAAFRYITPDGDVNDWWNVARIQDSDDGVNHHDLQEAAIANDDDRLYFYVRVDDTPYSGTDPDYWGDVGVVEYINILIDADNNPATGGQVVVDARGGSYTLGVEYSMRIFKRDSTDTRAVQLYQGDITNGLTNRFYNSGTRLWSHLDDVSALYGIVRYDAAEPLTKVQVGEFFLPLDQTTIQIGDTIAWTAFLTISGDSVIQADWIDGDEAPTYTLSAMPGPVSSGAYGSGTMDSYEEDNLVEYYDYAQDTQFYDERGDGQAWLDIIELSAMNDDEYIYFRPRIDNTVKDETTDPAYPLGLEHLFFGKHTSVIHYVDMFIDIDNDPNTGVLYGPAGSQIGVEMTITSARRYTSSRSVVQWAGVRTGSNYIPDINEFNTGINTNAGLREYITGSTAADHDDVDEWETRLALQDEIFEYDLTPGSQIKILMMANNSGGDAELDWAGPFTYTIADKPATQTLSTYKEIVLDGGFDDWKDVAGVKDGLSNGANDHNLVEAKLCNDDTFLAAYVETNGTPQVTPNYLSSPWLAVTPWNDLAQIPYFGDSGRVEYIGVYLDTDNNPATGEPVSAYTPLTLSDYTIGAEYTMYASRRVSSGTMFWVIAEGDKFGIAGDTIYTEVGHPGIAPAGDPANVDYRIEYHVPLDHLAYDPATYDYENPNPAAHVGVGDTIGVVVRLQRSGDYPDRDWVDYKFEYTVTEQDVGCGDWGYAPGDLNKDCYVDQADLAIIQNEWNNCTNPQGCN